MASPTDNPAATAMATATSTAPASRRKRLAPGTGILKSRSRERT